MKSIVDGQLFQFVGYVVAHKSFWSQKRRKLMRKEYVNKFVSLTVLVLANIVTGMLELLYVYLANVYIERPKMAMNCSMPLHSRDFLSM